MKKFTRLLFFLTVTLFFSLNIFSQECTIASFNTLRLGQNKKDMKKTADAIQNFSLIGLIEVMNKKGVEELVDVLEENTNEEWEYFISPYSVGTDSYQEYYAFIWKKDKVTFLKELGFYEDTMDHFIREPFGANFKIGNFDFYFVLSHFIYGRKKSLREAEANYLNDVYNYFQNLSQEENDIIIAGDFNLPANNRAFSPLTIKNEDLVFFAIDPSLKTTIGTKGFANSYDNIFISKKYTNEFSGISGAYDFTQGDYIYSRKNISDHLPIFIDIDCETPDDD